MTAPAPALSRRSGWAADQPIGYLMHKALAHPELVSLAAGFVDQASLPVEATRAAALDLLADAEVARAALQYGTTAGDPALRGLIAERLRTQDGPGAPAVTVESVVLTAGSNQMLWLLADALLDPGDVVLCDSPTYFVFMGVVRNMGARAVGIESDEHGMRPEALQAELERIAARGELERVKAIYVVSYFDNPRSVSLSADRRARICELAKRYSRRQTLYVLEDAAYRELRFEGEDQRSVRAYDAEGTHVVYAGTFSKSFSPGIRVGYGVLPRALLQPILELKGNLDFGSPHWNQRLLAKVLERGAYEPHVAALRALYASKRSAMLRALDATVGRTGIARYGVPGGGLYVWVELPEAIDAGPLGPLFDAAVQEGMLYVPGQYCVPGATPRRNCLRLSFGVQSEERIALGVERFARALAGVSG